MDIYNDKYINLNRLTFIDNNRISSTCPFFVIEFLAKSSGIKYDFSSDLWTSNKTELDIVINAIEKYSKDKVNILDLDHIENRLRDIALFINPRPDIQWKNKDNLFKAFWSIYNFIPKLPIHKDAFFGYKTDLNPYAIDPVMSYIIALKYNIKTKRETTLEEINTEIINYCSRLTPIRESIIRKITRFSRKGLFELYSHFKSESPTSEGRKYPLKIDNSTDCIAKYFRIDVSESKYPEEEYRIIDSVDIDKYIPYDSDFEKKLKINRKFFYLDNRYIKKYDHLYDENKKKILIYKNGGSIETDYLVTGVHPYYKHIDDPLRTIINMDPVSNDSDERYNNILSTENFIITRDELICLWDNSKTFISPCDQSKEFTDEQLMMIKYNSSSKHPIINFIYKLKSERESIIDKGLLYCLKDELESNIILTKVLILGMTIRGYNICYEHYPLEKSTYDVGLYQDKIEKECGIKAIYLLENHKNFLSNIPLLTGRKKLGSNNDNFNINTYGKGDTILNCINNMLNFNSVKSCIRTNSNYLLITSWYYLKQLNNQSPFTLSNLRFIS